MNEIWGLQYIGEIHLRILKRRWKDAIETHKESDGRAFGKLKTYDMSWTKNHGQTPQGLWR